MKIVSWRPVKSLCANIITLFLPWRLLHLCHENSMRLGLMVQYPGWLLGSLLAISARIWLLVRKLGSYTSRHSLIFADHSIAWGSTWRAEVDVVDACTKIACSSNGWRCLNPPSYCLMTMQIKEGHCTSKLHQYKHLGPYKSSFEGDLLEIFATCKNTIVLYSSYILTRGQFLAWKRCSAKCLMNAASLLKLPCQKLLKLKNATKCLEPNWFLAQVVLAFSVLKLKQTRSHYWTCSPSHSRQNGASHQSPTKLLNSRQGRSSP
jgi:hypothetical protein